MFHGGYDCRLHRKIAPDIQRRRAGIGLADGGRARRSVIACQIAEWHAEEENRRRAPEEGVYISYWTVFPFDISLSAVPGGYDQHMNTAPRSYSKLAVGLTVLFSLAAAVTVLILPGDGEGLRYLIAGTSGSAVILAAVFGLFVSGRLG